MRAKMHMEKRYGKKFQGSIWLQAVIQENRHVDFFRVEISLN